MSLLVTLGSAKCRSLDDKSLRARFPFCSLHALGVFCSTHATDSPLALPLGVFCPTHATDSLLPVAPEFPPLFKFLHHACLFQNLPTTSSIATPSFLLTYYSPITSFLSVISRLASPLFSDSPTSLFGGGCLSHRFSASPGFTGLLICGCRSSLRLPFP